MVPCALAHEGNAVDRNASEAFALFPFSILHFPFRFPAWIGVETRHFRQTIHVYLNWYTFVLCRPKPP